MINKDLLQSRENAAQYSVTTYMGKEPVKRMNTGTGITDSLCCTPQTNTAL